MKVMATSTGNVCWTYDSLF